MAIQAHLHELEKKHGEIERELEQAQNHPSVDDLELVDLKRKKLMLKDEIERLKSDVVH